MLLNLIKYEKVLEFTSGEYVSKEYMSLKNKCLILRV